MYEEIIMDFHKERTKQNDLPMNPLFQRSDDTSDIQSHGAADIRSRRGVQQRPVIPLIVSTPTELGYPEGEIAPPANKHRGTRAVRTNSYAQGQQPQPNSSHQNKHNAPRGFNMVPRRMPQELEHTNATHDQRIPSPGQGLYVL